MLQDQNQLNSCDNDNDKTHLTSTFWTKKTVFSISENLKTRTSPYSVNMVFHVHFLGPSNIMQVSQILRKDHRSINFCVEKDLLLNMNFF